MPRHPLRRIVLGAGIALAAVNIWTGAPLAALWIGSRLQSGSQTTMVGVFSVALLLAVFCLALVWLLGVLSEAYDAATGAAPRPRAQAPWLRSMRGERAAD